MDNGAPNNKTPFERHRDGNLECAIWRKETDKGVMYNTELKRSYRDEQGNWHTSHAISERDLLRAAHLQKQAYDTIQKARTQDRAQYVQRQQSAAQNTPHQTRDRAP